MSNYSFSSNNDNFSFTNNTKDLVLGNNINNTVYEKAKQDWISICNKEGFIYFYKKSTGDCQWAFPKIYDPIKKKYKSL